jgi:hypothetical protein
MDEPTHEPENYSDIDPISLELVATLRYPFDMNFVDEKGGARWFRYDAWAWLEMFVVDHTNDYTHPVFRTKMPIETRQACFDACCNLLEDCRTAKQQELIDKCQSNAITKRQAYTDSGKLTKVYIYTVSPILDIHILSWWWKWGSKPKPPFAKGMNCQVALEVALLNSKGDEVQRLRNFI